MADKINSIQPFDFASGKAPKKVSKAVQEKVRSIMQQEGNKKAIDSEKEFDQLSELLASGSEGMNNPEKDYIKGLMVEYQNSKAEQAKQEEEARIENETTKETRNLVKKIAKRGGDKKAIDNDDEAMALVNLLKNTKGDLNQADIVYIQQILIESGYGSLIEDSNAKQNSMDKNPFGTTSSNTVGHEAPEAQKGEFINEPLKPDDSNSTRKSEEPRTSEPKKTKPNPKVDKNPNKPARTEQEPKNYVPVIKEQNRVTGQVAAEDATKAIKDKGLRAGRLDQSMLLEATKTVGKDPHSAYTFFETFKKKNDSGLAEAMSRNGFYYRSILPAMKALHKMATKATAIRYSEEVINLAKEIEHIERLVKGDSRVVPSSGDAKATDKVINDVMRLLSTRVKLD